MGRDFSLGGFTDPTSLKVGCALSREECAACNRVTPVVIEKHHPHKQARGGM